MRGSNPDAPSSVIELTSDDLVDVENERASIFAAASAAHNVAMLTGTYGVVTPPLRRPRVRLPSSAEIHEGAVHSSEEDDPELARLRAVLSQRAGDPVGTLRIRLELALALRVKSRLVEAKKEAEAAVEAHSHAPAAYAMLRAFLLGRDALDEQLAHVGELARCASRERVRADWVCERARLLEARDGVSELSVAAWNEALALVPDHAAALYGAEVSLEAAGRYDELADVLARITQLLKGGEIAAWLHVERALLFDRRLDDITSARASLSQALELSPGLGPVRAVCVDHAVRHRDDAALASLLESEAVLERDSARAARLELDAALALLRVGADHSQVVQILERAYGRSPTTTLVDVRIAEELARLHDSSGRHEDALRVRKTAIQWCEEPREELVALRAIAVCAERAGEIDDAVLALERARVLEPEDVTLLSELDRLLTSTKRHDARTVLWMREAARATDPDGKARALLVAAAAAREAGRAADALRHLEAAWLTAPFAPGVYDARAEKLSPVSPTSSTRERIDFYEQAIGRTKEVARKVHLLEKLAWLKDDVVGDAIGAARSYDEILSLEPKRLSAIVGLASVATRSGDDEALARALSLQADVTEDEVLRAELLLRSAEVLASVDPERALARVEGLKDQPAVMQRAAEVITRLHADAGRWERVAESLAQRAEKAEGDAQRVALTLAGADVLTGRLRAPERALEALSGLGKVLQDDAAVRAATLEALEVLGDEERLRSELVRLAEHASSPLANARLCMRAAELDENRGRDDEAVTLYERALAALPDDPMLVERVHRIGARVPLGPTSKAFVSPFMAAVRALETDDAGTAEPLLSTAERHGATLRVAERLARRARSAPHLANALALAADTYPSGIMACRALEGLASLVAWTLPVSDDYDPWERALALGSSDVAALDALVQRARPRAEGGDLAAMEAVTKALRRRIELAADDTERLVLHLDAARLFRLSGNASAALEHAKRALACDPRSPSAACLLAELAAEVDDASAAIAASRALAELVSDAKVRSELLRDAGDLSAAHGDEALAVELLEQALKADPEAVQTAARLSEIQRRRGALSELSRVLRDVLDRARSASAIVPIGSELADIARNSLDDPMLAIMALERVREVDPSHVPSLFLLAELFIGQRAWDKALVALADAVAATNEPAEKLVALVGRASIYRRVLGQPALAEVELRTALEIDPHDTRAVRGLLDLGEKALSMEERTRLLERLLIGESTPAERLQTLALLAEARRALGDFAGAEGALVEAASISPDLDMLERVRRAVGQDTETFARVLSRAVARAHESGHAIAPNWLVELGHIELDLGRVDEAIERFEEALRADDGRADARFALARALSARGRHEPAVEALAPIIAGAAQRLPIDASLVRLYESSLSGAGRTVERWVARELRALAGDLAPNEQSELDARIGNVGYAEGLSASSLRKSVMPGGIGRHPIWDIAALCASFAGKLVRVGLAEQGASSRDRVKPRAAHPVRPIFDRVAKAFDVVEVELAVSECVAVPTIACEDVPWIIVPSSLASFTDAYALATLARPMTRIALGVPWLGALSSHEVLALFVGFARLVSPKFAARPSERIEPLVEECEQKARRVIDRRRRRWLEELEPSLDRAPPIDDVVFAEAVLATEARAAFLLSGSLRASLDAVAPTDAALAEALRVPGPPSLTAVFGHPSSRDLAAFALQSETTALRRSLGTA